MTEGIEIRPFQQSMIDAVVRLSLRAWEPVFASIEATMDPQVYRALHPDWRVSQRAVVETACSDRDTKVWVAQVDAQLAGFVATKIHDDGVLGEVYLIGVDPDSQRRGIATRLTNHALESLRGEGAKVAMVETGGDPGHSPARKAYESAGFHPFPIAKYFKML